MPIEFRIRAKIHELNILDWKQNLCSNTTLNPLIEVLCQHIHELWYSKVENSKVDYVKSISIFRIWSDFQFSSPHVSSCSENTLRFRHEIWNIVTCGGWWTTMSVWEIFRWRRDWIQSKMTNNRFQVYIPLLSNEWTCSYQAGKKGGKSHNLSPLIPNTTAFPEMAVVVAR